MESFGAPRIVILEYNPWKHPEEGVYTPRGILLLKMQDLDLTLNALESETLTRAGGPSRTGLCRVPHVQHSLPKPQIVQGKANQAHREVGRE